MSYSLKSHLQGHAWQGGTLVIIHPYWYRVRDLRYQLQVVRLERYGKALFAGCLPGGCFCHMKRYAVRVYEELGWKSSGVRPSMCATRVAQPMGLIPAKPGTATQEQGGGPWVWCVWTKNKIKLWAKYPPPQMMNIYCLMWLFFLTLGCLHRWEGAIQLIFFW